MDGTLIESGGAWDRALLELGVRHGHTLPPEFFAEIVGLPSADAVALARRRFGPSGEHVDADVEWVQARALALLRSTRSTWFPHARQLVADCREAGLRVALVTSSERVFVHAQLTAEERSWFDHIVAREDVPVPKPDPEPYRAAARLLGVEPETCVVVEDSAVGVASALRAGCSVAAVRRGIVTGAADALRLQEFDSLDELTVAVLRRVHCG